VSAYLAQVKAILLVPVVAVLAAVVTLSGGVGAAAGGWGGCVVPRLFALTPGVAEARVTAAGCLLGGVAYTRPHAQVALFVGQVPGPGAVVPRGVSIELLVS
jgi:Na+/glutamate symporter